MEKKNNVPLVTLEKSNVTNGTSIGNVGKFQRHQWNIFFFFFFF
jgi:hypothetical protein